MDSLFVLAGLTYSKQTSESSCLLETVRNGRVGQEQKPRDGWRGLDSGSHLDSVSGLARLHPRPEPRLPTHKGEGMVTDFADALIGEGGASTHCIT